MQHVLPENSVLVLGLPNQLGHVTLVFIAVERQLLRLVIYVNMLQWVEHLVNELVDNVVH